MPCRRDPCKVPSGPSARPQARSTGRLQVSLSSTDPLWGLMGPLFSVRRQLAPSLTSSCAASRATRLSIFSLNSAERLVTLHLFAVRRSLFDATLPPPSLEYTLSRSRSYHTPWPRLRPVSQANLYSPSAAAFHVCAGPHGLKQYSVLGFLLLGNCAASRYGRLPQPPQDLLFSSDFPW